MECVTEPATPCACRSWRRPAPPQLMSLSCSGRDITRAQGVQADHCCHRRHEPGEGAGRPAEVNVHREELQIEHMGLRRAVQNLPEEINLQAIFDQGSSGGGSTGSSCYETQGAVCQHLAARQPCGCLCAKDCRGMWLLLDDASTPKELGHTTGQR